jgi:hypothetical protein
MKTTFTLLSETEKELILKELIFVLNFRIRDAESCEMALQEKYVEDMKAIINKFRVDA